MPSNDRLPPKESALFRKLLKCYEMKQYKNGLKLAKQILTNPKFTEHGETLAMKGLTLNGLGRRDEAYQYVRRGLRNDLKSHVCWHVYGLLQRSDKKYDEAIKCYRNALKWEKDNLQILKDLSLLQIQMRDLEGYRETRHQLFKLRPSQHASWIGFAMSYHLLGDYETANIILETFRQSQALVENYDYRNSELLLYQNQILIESENYDKALEHLNKFSVQIFDKLALKETTGDLHLKLGQNNLAVPIFEQLIKRNPENTIYYMKYFEAKGITDGATKLSEYKKFQAIYPYAMCPRRLPLDIASGDDFRTIVDEYLRRGLRKGVPPLFVNVRSLYKDGEKINAITQLIHEYYTNLDETGHFSKQDFEQKKPVEPPSALLWTLLFLSQHHDHLRDTERALKYINLALEHTPTLIELFVTKGRVYKHAGDPIEAYMWLDEAQSMDTADRYINSKCAKYMLQGNLIKEAEEICAKFTREGVSAMENLNEMQCMWFQTECALAYQRLGRWGDSLKKCHEVDRHFAEIIEDQFDFHTYCMRKMTLRSYVGLLRLEDILRSHPFYFKAAKCAIEVYIRLYDKPLESEQTVEEIDTGKSALSYAIGKTLTKYFFFPEENLPPAELKKLRNKQRKAKKKAELESAQAAQAAVKKEQHHKSKQQNPQDADPEAPQLDELIPEKLERPEDPLEKAIDFLKPLQNLAKDRIETHLLSFEVYFRKDKVLLMIQSVKRAYKMDPKNAVLHSCIVRLVKALTDEKINSLHPSVKTVVERSRTELVGRKTATQLNEEFISEHGKSIPHLLEGAKLMYALDPGKKESAISLVTSIDMTNAYLEDCTKVYECLRDGEFGDCSDQLKLFKERCHKRFKYACIFKEAEPSENHVNEAASNIECHAADM